VAEQGQGQRQRRARGEGESRDTRRMVLKRERVLVLPEGVDSVDEKKLREALGVKPSVKIVTTPAWVECGEQLGASKQHAIEAFAGKPGTPDARPGDYKAVGLSAWKGGRRYVKPPEPKVEAQDID
jgi:hypothetical protein